MDKEQRRITSVKVLGPIVFACVILLLIFLTVPLSLSPASVSGAYENVQHIQIVAPPDIALSPSHTIAVIIVGTSINIDDIDTAHIEFEGAHATNWSIVDGNLIAYFNTGDLSLNADSTEAMLVVMTKDGSLFVGIAPVIVSM